MSETEKNTLDPELLKKIRATQSGDQAAFEELLDRYMPLIRSLSSRFSKAFEAERDREDLQQAATVAFLRAVEQYDPTRENAAGFGTYAAYCIKHALISELRSMKKWDNVVLLEDDGLAADTLMENPVDRIIEEEDYRALTNSIRSVLSPFENRIWWLYLSGRTAKEIAAQIGKDERSVHNAIFRIRRKLRAVIPTP